MFKWSASSTNSPWPAYGKSSTRALGTMAVSGSAAIGFNGGSQATSKGRSSFEIAGRRSVRAMELTLIAPALSAGVCSTAVTSRRMYCSVCLRLVIQAADKPFSEFLLVSL